MPKHTDHVGLVIAGAYDRDALRVAAAAHHVDGSACAHVLLVLAAHADRDGLSWPSVPTLSTGTTYGARTVNRALAALAEAGIAPAVGFRGRARMRRLNLTPTSATHGATTSATHGTAEMATSATRAPHPRHGRATRGARIEVEVEGDGRSGYAGTERPSHEEPPTARPAPDWAVPPPEEPPADPAAVEAAAATIRATLPNHRDTERAQREADRATERDRKAAELARLESLYGLDPTHIPPPAVAALTTTDLPAPDPYTEAILATAARQENHA